VNLRKSLDILTPRNDPDPLFAANNWVGLSTATRVQQNVAEAWRAYESAVAAFETRKKISVTRVDRATMGATLAKLHADFENFPAALRETDRALEHVEAVVRFLLRLHVQFFLKFPDLTWRS
jgi:hypothetical protein